jgi:hypothetical protein
VVDSELFLHAGADCSATCIGAGTPNPTDPIRVNGVQTGDNVLIRIGAQSMSFGIGQISAQAVPLVSTEDSYATPMVIAGFGAFDFEATSATDPNFNGGSFDGQPLPGGQQMYHDVFLTWTAQSSGDAAFVICGAVTDVTLAVHLSSDCIVTCVTGDNREE